MMMMWPLWSLSVASFSDGTCNRGTPLSGIGANVQLLQ